ncbi:MAG: M20 family metallopeptidase [Treponemataceae bacterium]|nr:MAG: M20 family metallopeptidase [Treponemataceae bacterium]
MNNFSLQEYLEALARIVNIDSGSKNTEGTGKIAAFFEERYTKLGLAVRKFYPSQAGGPCLEIRNKPESDTIDVLFLGHMDTVFPDGTAAARPFKNENGMLYGPGVYDMKSGLLSIYYTIKELLKNGTDISFCVAHNSDEEISSPYSREWLCALGRKSRYGLIFESGRKNGDFVNKRKGLAKFRLEFSGIAAHAGVAPEKGASAVLEMSRWINELALMNNYEAGTSLNAGAVSGGTAANVVAANAWCEIDTRFTAVEELDKIKQKIDELSQKRFDGRVTVTSSMGGYRPPMNPGERTFELMRLFEECGKAAGISVNWISTGGGSDGNLIAHEGCAVIDSLGPSGDKSHSDEEYALVDSIEPRLNLMAQVVKKLA